MLHELLAGVVRTGEAFWAKDLLFELERYGFPEETYFDVSYDPVRVESGDVGGVYCIVTETTERVVGERRLALLKDLAAAQCHRAHDPRRVRARHRDARRASRRTSSSRSRTWTTSCSAARPARRSSWRATPPSASRSCRFRRRATDARPAGWSSASIRGVRSTISTARSSNSSPIS